MKSNIYLLNTIAFGYVELSLVELKWLQHSEE